MDSTAFETHRRDREYRRVTRKRLILIGVSTTLLLVIILGAVLGTRNRDRHSSPTTTTTSYSIKSACSATRYPDTCVSSLSAAEGGNSTSNPEALFKLSLSVALEALTNISSLPDTLAAETDDTAVRAALADCTELITTAADRINDSLITLPDQPSATNMLDLRTWLSAAVTDQVTCLDGVNGTLHDKLSAAMLNATRLTSNSLAFAAGIQQAMSQYKNLLNRRLLAEELPRRALLQISRPPKADVIVAKDGSGHFETINGALSQVKDKSDRVFVIYIKAGVYKENVLIAKNQWNVMMIGDGMYETIVTGSLNVVDGSTTFRSATVAAVGKGFVAMDMGFRNTAGPEKEQAVAFRGSSDLSVYYRCSFDAYQDTLYVYALRQFYRECDIIGTVDFIFGDAIVVFQKCRIMPRQPLPGQKNACTAQGRTDPNENTGISIIGSTIQPYDNVTVPTYLGRPWKDYSTTVVMETQIGGIVEPEGWLRWQANVVPPATIFYAEFQNSGAGARLGGRVTWPGYRGTLSLSEAKKYAVDAFIGGENWIPKKGVEVTPDL